MDHAKTLAPSRQASPPAAETPAVAIRDFATQLLEKCGGAVDWDPASVVGVAILPEEVARRFGVKETTSLATRQEAGGLCVSLASDFLDLAQGVLEALVARIGSFRIPDPYLTRSDPQEIVARTFTWHNARVRYRKAEPREVEYHSWWFFGSLKSEDVWEARLNTTLNTESKAPVDLPEILDLPDLHPALEPFLVTPADTFEAASKVGTERLKLAASDFIGRMEARLERDRKRLREYYGALDREAEGSSTRKNAVPPTAEEIATRKRAVDLELRRKLGEMGERYRTEASLEPIALVSLRMTVLSVELHIQRKQAERLLRLYWNPLTKKLEPLGCSRCGQGTYSVAFTDNDVLVLCAKCHSA